MEIAEELLVRRAKLLVVACNSATAAALPALQRRMMETTLGVDVLGVVRPEAVQAVASTRTGRIGLLATPTTVASGAYERAVLAVDPHVTLHRGRVPDAGVDHPGRRAVRRARGAQRARGVRAAARGGGGHGDPRLHPLPADRADAPADARPGGDARQLRGGARAPGRARAAPRAACATRHAGEEGDYRFLCTGDVEAFREQGTRFLQMPLGAVEQVRLAAVGGGSREPRAQLRARARRAAPGDDRAGVRAHRDRARR